nr:hypothetical protein [Cyanobacteria bacterium UBA8530]
MAILGATNFESMSTHWFSIVNQVSLVLVGVTGLHLSTLFPKPLRVFEKSDLLQGILYFPLLIFLPLIILLYPHPDLWRYCFYAIISISSLGVISITLSSLFTTVARNSSPIAKSQAWIVLLGGLVGAFPTVLAYAGGVVGIPSFLLGISNLLLLIFPCAIAYAI